MMKMWIRYIGVLLLTAIPLSLFGEQSSIDQQIQAIKSASPQQRVALMNKLKRELVKMNIEQRVEALTKLQVHIHPSSVHTTESLIQNNIQKMQQHNVADVVYDTQQNFIDSGEYTDSLKGISKWR